jgi:hypothetical protein
MEEEDGCSQGRDGGRRGAKSEKDGRRKGQERDGRREMGITREKMVGGEGRSQGRGWREEKG